MRKHIKVFAGTILLSAASLLLAACTAQKEKEEVVEVIEREPVMPTGESTYTLMVYMIGSDLESGGAAATNDMAEMMANEVDPDRLNVVVYTGGSKKWHSDIDKEENGVYLLKEAGFEKVTSFELASMGTPENLTGFLDYAYTEFPADIYSLILWDHGNGPIIGYGMDKLFDNDSLTLPEIEQALEASPFGPENRLAFIGFDACLMASVELASAVDDYADIMIASQETEPGYGWNYDFLDKCLSLNTNELAGVILDSYLEYDRMFTEQNPLFANEVTLSAVDLAYAQQLEFNVNRLFKAASANVGGDFVDLAGSRLNTRSFGRATTGSEYDLVDLLSLTETMNELYPKECEAIRSTLDSMVIDSRNNTSDSCGLSLYYPYYNKAYYKKTWKNEYAKLGILSDYVTYLERYDQVWLGTDMKSFFDTSLTAQEKSSGVYSVQLSDEQAGLVGSASFRILRKVGETDYSTVYCSDNTEIDGNTVKAYFDNKIIFFTDNYGGKCIPLLRELETRDGVTAYTAYAQVVAGEGDTFTDLFLQEQLHVDVNLSVNNDTEEVRITGVYETVEDDLAGGKRKRVNLKDYTLLSFIGIKGRMLVRDENGLIADYKEWPEDSVFTLFPYAIANGCSFRYETMYRDGYEYYLMIDITDVQGNTYETELFPVVLDEEPTVAVEYRDVQWTEGDRVTLSDDKNVKIELVKYRDAGSFIDRFYLEIHNKNKFAINFDLDNVILNDEYYLFAKDLPSIMHIDANGTEIAYLDAVNPYIFYGEITHIDTIKLSFRSVRLDTHAYIYDTREQNVNVIVTTEIATLNGAVADNAKETVLFDDDTVEVVLIEALDEEKGIGKYVFRITNRGSSTIALNLGDFVFNDEIIFAGYGNTLLGGDDNYDVFMIGARDCEYYDFYAVRTLLESGEIEKTENVSIGISYVTLLEYFSGVKRKMQHFEYTFGGDEAMGFCILPYRDAEFDRQVLADTDEVNITLLSAGWTPDPDHQYQGEILNNELKMVFLIENKTDRNIPVDLGLFNINGTTVRRESFVFMMNSADYTYLPAGKKGLLVAELTGRSLDAQHISSIETFSAQILTSERDSIGAFDLEGGDMYDIALTAHGESRFPEFVSAVYADNWLEVYLIGAEADAENNKVVWEYYIYNKTDRYISVNSLRFYLDGRDVSGIDADLYAYDEVYMKLCPESGGYGTYCVYYTDSVPAEIPELSCDLRIYNQAGTAVWDETGRVTFK